MPYEDKQREAATQSREQRTMGGTGPLLLPKSTSMPSGRRHLSDLSHVVLPTLSVNRKETHAAAKFSRRSDKEAANERASTVNAINALLAREFHLRRCANRSGHRSSAGKPSLCTHHFLQEVLLRVLRNQVRAVRSISPNACRLTKVTDDEP